MKKTVLILATLFISIIGFSQTFTDGNFTYSVASVGDTVILTGYDEVSGGTDVIIPATVVYNSLTYNVGYLGYESFMSKGITSVVIPEGVVHIVNRAFIFNNISTLVIPNSVKGIYGAAFGNNPITDLTLGANLVIIEENAFNGCSLTSLDLPTGVTTLNKQCFANNNIVDLVIPNHITIIEDGVFGGNPLATVTSVNMTPADIVTALDLSDSFSSDRSNIDLFIPAGTMGVYVTDPGAEWVWFKSVTEVDLTASIDDSYLDNELSVFPNPVSAQLTIDSDLEIENITIVTSMGQTVKVNVALNNTIDVSELTNGIYFLQIQTNKGLVSKKFIKKD